MRLFQYVILPTMLCVVCSCKSRKVSADLAGGAPGPGPCFQPVFSATARAWHYWPLPRPAAPFPLPTSFTSVNSDETQQQWRGADSSEISYAVRALPALGTSGSSALLSRLRRPRYRLEGTCNLTVPHRAGAINMIVFQHIDSAKTDTVFGFAAQLMIDSGTYASVLAFTPTLAMRDSLMGSVGLLEWHR